MKILLYIAFSLVTAAVGAAGASKDQLAGHWRYSEADRSCDNFFHRDGTFSGNVTLRGSVVWKYAGRWSLNDDTLNYQYTQSSQERIPAGTKGADKLIEITNDHYVVVTNDGSEHRYRRIGDDH